MGLLSHTTGQNQSGYLNTGVQLLKEIYCVVFFFSTQDIFSINKAEMYQFNSSIIPSTIYPLNHCFSPTKTSF